MEEYPIEIRVDDIFLSQSLTQNMVDAKTEKPFFEWFKEFDKILEEKKIHAILAVMADGIDIYPEWVEYLKKNIHRYQIELHGWNHQWYTRVSEEEGFRLLSTAKEKIEKTFGIKITRWYVPFSKRGVPWWGFRVCERLGIGLHTYGTTTPHFYFHYWKKDDHFNLKATWEMHKVVEKKKFLRHRGRLLRNYGNKFA